MSDDTTEGATCQFCEQPMLEADSCTKNVVLYPMPDDDEISGFYRLASPHGSGDDWDGDRDCHDCGVSPGGYHHPGCDNETSPLTGSQLLSEVIGRAPDRAPLHGRGEPDPHEHLSIEDIHEDPRDD